MKGGESNEENGVYLFGNGDVGNFFFRLRDRGRRKDQMPEMRRRVHSG